MSPDSIPQLSLGTSALIIFAVCAGFVLLRGMTRMLVGVGVLCLSAWIGFRVWQLAPALAIEWTGKPEAWISMGLPAIAFLAAFFLLRSITRFIVRPFGKPGENGDPPPRKSRLKLIALALIPTAFLWITAATLVHHIGSVAEVRAYAEQSAGAGKTTPSAFIQSLKVNVEGLIPPALLQFLDPLAEPSRLSLAKLIATRSDAEPVIDPKTGKPYPRAIIVDDPELQHLAREGRFSTLLRHPLLNQAANDPEVRKLIDQLQN